MADVPKSADSAQVNLLRQGSDDSESARLQKSNQKVRWKVSRTLKPKNDIGLLVKHKRGALIGYIVGVHNCSGPKR
jgi:hypothetical protein